MSFQRILGFGALAFLALRAAAQVTWTGAGADGNFTTPTNWSAALLNDGTANLSFSVSTATVPVVNANFSVNSIAYQSGSPTISVANTGGASLTVKSSISLLTNAYQTITAPLSVGSSFTFSGSGSTSYLNLTGGVTAPSGFAVQSGADVRVSGGWNVTGPVTVQSGSALEFVNTNVSLSNSITNNGAVGFGNGTNTITYTGVISGSGSVTINSPTTFGATNSYGGSTTIGPATLTLGANNAVPAISPVSISNDAASVLNLNGYNQTISWLSGGGPAGGKILLGAGTLTLAPSGGLNFDGVISGAGSVVVNGGVATLSGANQYAGGTTINGTLDLINTTGSGTGTGSVLVAPGGTLRVGLGGTTGAVTGTIVNNGAIRFNRTDVITYGGLSGNGAVIQDGTGTLTLSGSNTYTGNTVVGSGVVTDAAAGALPSNSDFMISSGTLKVAYNESIRLTDNITNPSGGVTIDAGAALTLAGGRYYSGSISGAGSLVIGSGVFQTLTGAVTHTGGTTISPTAMLHLGDGLTSGSFAGNIVDNGGLIFSPASTGATYAGAVTGTGNLFVGTATDSLTGAVTLTGANAYAGYTMVNSGTLRIGAVNTLPITTTVMFQSSGTLDVALNQTVAKVDSQNYGANILLGSGATLKVAPAAGTYGGTFNGLISGTGNLMFAGAANTGFTLNNTNTYTGTTTISSGTVFVGSNGLGTGQVTVMSGAQLAIAKSPSTYDVTLPNSVVVSDQAAFGSDKDRLLILNGSVTVPTASSTVHVHDWVNFAGPLKSASGSSLLGFDSAGGSYGRAVITGTINPTGATGTIAGFNINSASVVFGAASAVPAAPFTIKGTSAYVGIAKASGTAPSASSVLNLIDKTSFTGVIGFDTLARDAAPTVFSDAVDLTGFGANVSLGSGSSAVLTGTITPDGDYRFGNGGGVLVVTSQLTGSRGVVVNSSTAVPGNYLTLVLRNTGTDVNGNAVALPANNFTGNLSILNSLVVLDSASALPSGRTVSLGANGYIGYTEVFTGNSSLADFVNTRLVPGAYTGTSVLGVDSHAFAEDQLRYGYSYSERWFDETIDLRALGPIYLGTATRTTLDGVIWAPNQAGAAKTLSLLAAGDATLTVDSPLRAGNVDKVVVGSSTSAYASGTVVLRGANTYAGGTTLQSGVLQVSENMTKLASSGPLGTGVLTVPASANKPVLAADGYSAAIVTNPISLGRSLQIGLPDMTPLAYSTAGVETMSGPYGSGHLFLNGVISDIDAATHGSLDVYAPTYLNAPNSFSGGVTLHDTFLALGSDSSLGTGTLTFGPPSAPYSYSDSVLATYSGPRTIANNLVFSGSRDNPVTFTGNASFTFTGSLTLNNDMTLSPDQRPVYFNGPITGGARLLSEGTGAVVLGGTNSYAGGTEAQYGTIIFANAAAMPATPNFGAFTTGWGGYIGIQFVPANLQSTFVDRFNKGGSSGAIGFDSANVTAPNTFAGTIDLRGFNGSARLGSASSAILTGAITPQNSTYNFGNGGGLLEVRSMLTDGSLSSQRSVDVDSDSSAPLTVRLTGANTFSGGTNVRSSGLIFGPGALPASGLIDSSYNGYVGTADTTFAANPNTFVTRFSSTVTDTIIGFDDGMNVTGGVSLASFTSASPNLFLGTATTATLSGGITLPATQSDYRFAGYKGGHLTVASTLSGANAVTIGDGAWEATFATPADLNGPLSSVKLAAANSYTGGTDLAAGELVVASPTGSLALGTGALTVSGQGSNGRNVRLLTEDSAQTVGNAIVLNSSLDVGDRLGGNNLTLTGNISGTGTLYKIGTDLLTISGTNTSTGGLYVEGGAVTFQHSYSVGAGPLQFLNASTAAVTFNESSTVNGISGDSFGQYIYMTPGGSFTVNQRSDAEFKGVLAVLNTPVTDVIFSGTPTSPARLTLSGASTYTSSGATKINGGITVVAANASAFGQSTNMVNLNGGKLAVATGVVLANPMVLTAGELAGSGTFKAAAASTGYAIGSNLALSPGVASVAELKLDMSGTSLVLASGGKYQWDLSDATAANGWDKVTVTGNVNVTSTPTAPFAFKIGTIGADGSSSFAANFDPALPYSWTLLSATSINGFTSNGQFVLDTSGFLNPNTGFFSLTQTGSALLLNFSPVPEPSTYALLLAGLVVTVFTLRRRRR